ncbi:MAG: hypothetical protein CVU03_01930 [Bacteroidetes bacterium HGW-Bacteroidetes-2]|jgi:hypothetical protein|nr:MAG: hypothetical protein CVU13_06385 [Bacteroidetes bacterium HGW-Bacteroidetes-8]PKP26657.1 MAG: hypothetical protein CVU03_01930 [Bacteroidetes bacterium HGW-Bacteroidetes-2]
MKRKGLNKEMKNVCPKLDEKVKRTKKNKSELFAIIKDLESFFANQLLLVIEITKLNFNIKFFLFLDF